MNTPFAFDTMLLFAFLSVMLLSGIFLRAKISFFQKMLFPSCLIGGILGLLILNTGWLPFKAQQLETFAYHLFNISFISVGLTRDETPDTDQFKKKELIKGPGWMALVQGVTFPLQAVIGGLVVLVWGLFGTSLFKTFGFLVPLGFNEGPGQALSIGKVWESAGFEHAATIGLSFATIGFICAFFVGVPLANYGLRKGLAANGIAALPKDVLSGLLPANIPKPSGGGLTIHSGNAETLAFHAALVGLVYLISWSIIYGLGMFLPADAAKILWGFFFFFGLAVAIGVKGIMTRIGVAHLLDAGIQRRISGWSVDFLIVATVAAIQALIVWQFFFPIFISALLAGAATTGVVLFLGRRLGAYSLERTLAIYGTATGTVSCGLLLLRIVDPEFKTPVAKEIAVMNIFALPVVGVCTLLLNGPLWWGWSTAFTMLVFAGIMLLSLALLYVFKLVKRPDIPTD